MDSAASLTGNHSNSYKCKVVVQFFLKPFPTRSGGSERWIWNPWMVFHGLKGKKIDDLNQKTIFQTILHLETEEEVHRLPFLNQMIINQQRIAI